MRKGFVIMFRRGMLLGKQDRHNMIASMDRLLIGPALLEAFATI
jgi:hypothetical protein